MVRNNKRITSRIANSFLFFIAFFFISDIFFAQVGYVQAGDEIYQFLERMQTLDIIEDYNSFEIPKTRKEITGYLESIISNINKLDEIDKLKLNDFASEFEYDLYGSNNNSKSLLPEWDLKYLTGDKEKYLYFYSDTNNVSLYLNGLGIINYLSQNDNQSNTNSFLYRFGGTVRASLFNRIGIFAKVTNGSYSGSKKLVQNFGPLKYNFKINNETGSEIGDNFFDETEAYVMLNYDYAEIKIGNDRKLIGHGAHKILLSDHAPRTEYFELSAKYKSLGFTFFHGKLLGTTLHRFANPQANYMEIFDKYLVYHRLKVKLSEHSSLGLGEIIIYAKRNIDFSYLNPFNFYKSAEHLNQDRDNSMMFFDFQNNSVKGLKIYSTLLIDDIDFGKIGSGWYGNKTLMSFGVYSSLLYNYLPLDFELQYIKIEPYVFAHRLYYNNYTSYNTALGTELQPNTSAVMMNFFYRPYYRINMKLGLSYSVHGANGYDTQGNLIKNYGGNISEGHREGDSETVYFLDGNREYNTAVNFTATYEPKKNIILSLNANYNKKLLPSSQTEDIFFTNLSLHLKF